MRETLPNPLRVARILLFVVAVVVGLQIIGGFMIYELTPELLGVLLWTALPGIAALFLGLRLPKGDRGTMAPTRVAPRTRDWQSA